MNTKIHFAAYKNGKGKPLCVSKDNEEKLRGLKDAGRLDYESQDGSANNFNIYFNNYTGFFPYKDNGAETSVLVIHKKVCDIAEFCKGYSCTNTASTFECEHLIQKYNSFFEDFSLEIINGLLEHLPFSIIAPTSAKVNEGGFNDNAIFKLLLILQKKDEMRSAINNVLANPHRKLVEHETLKRYDEISYVDSNVIMDILHNQQRWIEHKGGCINNNHSPTAVLQYETEESFDTLENRFVKHFLKMLTEEIDKCTAYLEEKCALHQTSSPKQEYKNIEQTISDLKGYIEQTLSGWIFREVGSLSVFPSNSQVLMKQSGYRELFNISRLLRLSFVPTFFKGLDMAFELKSMDILWEYYVMLNIIEAIKACGYEIKKEDVWKEEIDKDTGAEYDYASFEFKSESEKVVNVKYQESVEVGKQGDYKLRPDFLLKKDGTRLVFDAKFMVKENIPTGDLSKYLTISLPNKQGKLSHAVIAACPGKADSVQGIAFSFTNMFDEQKCKSFNYPRTKNVIKKMLLNNAANNGNQYIGYVEIKLPVKEGIKNEQTIS